MGIPWGPDERTYSIVTECGERVKESHYFAGMLPDGTQVLMFTESESNHGLFFTPEGIFLELRSREMLPTVYTNEDLAAQELFAWQDEMGWKNQRITVRKFRTKAPVRVSIDDYESWMRQEWFDGDEICEGEEEAVEEWHSQNNFVLRLPNREYIIDGEGNPNG